MSSSSSTFAAAATETNYGGFYQGHGMSGKDTAIVVSIVTVVGLIIAAIIIRFMQIHLRTRGPSAEELRAADLEAGLQRTTSESSWDEKKRPISDASDREVKRPEATFDPTAKQYQVQELNTFFAKH